MILRDVRCVVLDVDDTLYLERDYVRSGFAAVGHWLSDGRKVDGAGFAEAAWGFFEDGVRGDTFDRALRHVGLEPVPLLIDELVTIYRSHTPSISLLEDALACLDVWSGDRRVAVVTDGPAESQRAKVHALNLVAWCDPIVVTAELGPGFSKPSPQAFEMVASVTGVDHPFCAYIADNPAKDFLAPIELGWRTVRVRRPGSLHEGIDTATAVDVEIADLVPLL